MKEKLTDNIGRKILSVLIAFGIWLAVVNISNPETTGSKVIPVAIVNEKVITDAGMTYNKPSVSNVTVSYSVRTRDAYKIKASDFEAYIDLADIYSVTGAVPVTLNVLNNKDLLLNTPVVRPSIVKVDVEEMISKTVGIQMFTTGEPEEGYKVSGANTSRAEVSIHGPRSLVSQIDFAGIVIDVDKATRDFSGSTEILYYNPSGSSVDVSDPRFSAEAETADYQVYMITGKEVPIQYEVSGVPAEGYRLAGTSASLESVTVQGSSDDLAALSAVVIPSSQLNIQGATANKSWNIDVSTLISNDLKILGSYEVNVTARIEPNRIVINTAPNPHGGPGVGPSTAATETEETGPAATEPVIGPGMPQETSATVPASQPETSAAETQITATSPAETQVPETSPAETQLPETSPAASQSPETSPAETQITSASPAEITALSETSEAAGQTEAETRLADSPAVPSATHEESAASSGSPSAGTENTPVIPAPERL